MVGENVRKELINTIITLPQSRKKVLIAELEAHFAQDWQKGLVITAMIRGWREVWRDANLPITFVDPKDLGSIKNVDELNHEKIGRRLADWALSEVYEKRNYE